ncbi:MAG: B12-binding domain-containing radical SAM protein [Candidatus Omnitrophica bacterium]|nr:B12-binding domain-containing radical SAM protein [Candidatus Omnitrophota bacterium]
MKKVAVVLLPLFWPGLPPLGLACIKGYLGRNDIACDTLDFNNYFFNLADDELKKEWRKSCNALLEENIVSIIDERFGGFSHVLDKLAAYDVVGFSCFKSNINTVRHAASLLKKLKNDIRIILGGPEIARLYFKHGEEFFSGLKSFCDLVVVGEGEEPFLKFIRCGYNGGERVEKFIEIQDERSLPFPDYSDFDFDLYPKKSAVSLMFSRGCVRKCGFCSETLLYNKYRVYTADNMLDQIASYRQRGINRFIFHDSMINGSLAVFEELLEGMIYRFGTVNWEAQIAVRADMREKIFESIKKSGCYHLFVGLESGSEKTLKTMRKGFTSDEALAFFKKLKKYDISFGVSMIVGYPGETEDDFYDSLDFVVRNKEFIPKIEQINPFQHYDGTHVLDGLGCVPENEAARRVDTFIREAREAGIKITNAFVNNLVGEGYHGN